MCRAARRAALADAEALADLNLPVVGPVPQFSGNAQVVAPAADTSASIDGITPAYQDINSLTVASGTFISVSDVRCSARARPTATAGRFHRFAFRS